MDVHYDTITSGLLCGAASSERSSSNADYVTCPECQHRLMDSLQPQGGQINAEVALSTPANTTPLLAFKFIKAGQFFPAYCPTVRQYKQKVAGTTIRGRVVTFTDADRQAIRAGLIKLFTDLNTHP